MCSVRRTALRGWSAARGCRPCLAAHRWPGQAAHQLLLAYTLGDTRGLPASATRSRESIAKGFPSKRVLLQETRGLLVR